MRDFDSIRQKEMGIFEDRVRHIYNRGYEDGLKDGKESLMDTYNAGLDDAWECARKLVHRLNGGYTLEEREEVFGEKDADLILLNNTASEAIAKVKTWEEKKKYVDEEIKVGDEVYSDAFDDKGIVTYITDDKVNCVCIICNGFTMMKVGTIGLHKTGRHFDAIEKVLEELKNEEN